MLLLVLGNDPSMSRSRLVTRSSSTAAVSLLTRYRSRREIRLKRGRGRLFFANSRNGGARISCSVSSMELSLSVGNCRTGQLARASAELQQGPDEADLSQGLPRGSGGGEAEHHQMPPEDDIPP